MKHIVILKKSVFNMIIGGKKTIESRWSMHKILPYNKIEVNDTLLLKETGKDVTYSCLVEDVKFFKLTPSIVKQIEKKYGKEIGMNKNAFKKVYNKKYCTLVWIKDVKKIDSIKVKRSYGNGWFLVE